MKNILLFTALLCVCFKTYSQTDPHPDRGLYVDKFFKYYIGTSTVDPNNTILGITAKENALLDYCKINHITHLALYDVDKILSASSNTYRTQLCTFIHTARNPPYCINTIGAAGETEDFFCNLFGSGNNCNPTSFQAIVLSSPQQILIGNYSSDLLNALTDASIGTTDPLFPYAQYMRYFWSALANPFVCGEQFDFMTIELEFWNLSSGATYSNQFKKILKDVNWIKQNIPNALSAQVELYLGRMTENYNNSNWYNPFGITGFIDGYSNGASCPLPQEDRKVDRVLLHSYVYDPANSYFYSNNKSLLISQIYGGGGAAGAQYQNDFVELHNATGSSIDLTGWSIQYYNGTSWDVINLGNPGGNLQAGRYYLIKLGSSGGSGSSLPTANLTNTSINIDPVNGKIALVKSQTPLTSNCPPITSFVDFVGYGSANCSEGSPAVSGSNTTSLVRLNNQCRDFEDNLNDFTTGVPVPRNTSSAANVCIQGWRTDYFKDACTNDATIIHPILSAERLDLGGDADFTGDWIRDDASHNIFEAERLYYQGYASDNNHTPAENVITPGAVMWFAQSFMQNIITNPILFTTNSPVCASGGSGNITFDYRGPIEQGISYTFTVSGSTPTTVSGITPLYNGTGFAITLPTCNRTPGTYTATLDLDYGCGTYSYSIPVKVVASPTVDVLTQNTSTMCEGSQVLLQASNGTSYSWVPGGATTQQISVSTSGTYTCTITGGSCAGSASVSVNMLSNPDFGITSSCPGNALTLTISPYTSGAISWNTNQTTQAINVSSSNNYRATITQSNGCIRQHVIPISGIPITQPTVSPSGPFTYCQGQGSNQTLQLSNPSGTYSGVTYSWLPDGQTTTSISPINPNSSTNYSIRVYRYGCYSESNPVVFTVNQIPIVTFSPSNPTICPGGSIGLTASGANSYTWTPATGLSCTNCPNPTASPASTTTYTVTGTSNGCSATATITVTVGANLTISIIPSNPTICPGGSTGLTASGANSYTWTPSTGLSCTNCLNPTASPASTTTYTVTGTANGCSGTSTVTVTVAPAISLSSTQTNVSCYGGSNGSATVTPIGGTPGYTFTWSPNVSSTSSITNRIAGNYVCTVRDANNCTASLTVTITEPPLLVLTPYGSNNTCIGSTNACAYANPSGGTSPYYYSWNTNPVQTISPICNLNNGTYTVTVTDSKGCTKTGSVTVVTSGICCGNYTNSLPQVISTTNMTAGLNYSDGLNPIFHYEVNSNCTLTNNTIEMEEAQYIVVHAPNTLILNGCTLRACGNLWKGIILEDGASIKLNGTFIYDAENAIHVMGLGDLQVRHSHFINNYIGINYEPFNTHSGIFNIDDTEFKGTGTMKGHYHNQTTVIGTVPLAGIILNDFDVNLIGVTNPNIFERMNSGFVIYDGTVTVNNAKFIDIQPDPLIPGNVFDGCGVYDDEPFAWGNSLTFQGFSYPYTNLNFAGCATGIRAEEININISDCNMGASGNHDMETGIHYLYGNTLSSFISNNSINATRYGINMEMLDGANDVTVSGNSIGIGNLNVGAPVSGIRVSNWGSFNYHGANPKYNIYHNYINLFDNVDNGIEFLNVNNFNLIDNHIYPSDNNLQVKGISLSASHQNEVSCNSVESTDPNYPRHDQAGIFSVKSSDNRYGCNDVDNTFNGFLFSLDCANAQLFGNTIKNHNVGLHLDQLGVIGQQPLVFPGSALPGNIWNGSCSQWDAWDENPLFDRYYYNNTTPSSYWQMGPQTYWPPSWFVFTPRTNFECGPYSVTGSYNPNPYCGNGTPDFGNGEGGSLDEKIANNELQFSSFNSEMIWSLKKYLFEKLKFNENLLDSDSTFVQFYDSVLNTIVGEFGDLKEKENEFFKQDSTASSIVVQKTLSIKNNLALIETLTEQLNDPNINSTVIQTLKLDIASLQTDNTTLKNEIALIVSQQNSGKLIVAGEAGSIIQSIISSETIEVNLKNINESYYSTFAQGNRNISPNQATLWQQIAGQCPVSGGEAVFKARSLYALVNPNIKYDDHFTCLQQGILYRKSHRNSVSNSYKIFPNPTNNSFTFYFLNDDPKSVLNIYDQFGRGIKSINLGLHRFSIEVDVSQLNPGIYNIQLIQNNFVSFQDRLVIIK